MTSLGIGGKRFSTKIARPAPGPPRVSIMSTDQPATPSTSVTSTSATWPDSVMGVLLLGWMGFSRGPSTISIDPDISDCSSVPTGR